MSCVTGDCPPALRKGEPMPSCRLVARPLAAALLLAATVLVVPRAAGGDKPDPIAAQVKASLKDPGKPFTMVVTLRAKEGAGEKIAAAFAKAVKATRRENGCVAYDLSRDTKAPDQYLVYERWRSLAALEAHLKSQHITALLGELGDLLAGPPTVRVLLPVGE